MKALVISFILNSLKKLDVAEALQTVAEYLYDRDKDTTGWDDITAACLDMTAEILIGVKNGDIKKVTLNSLEMVQTILENVDSNNEGWDDELAERIGKIKEKFDR